MKRVFIFCFCFSLLACDDNKKIIPYLKKKKEVIVNFQKQNFITNINFLFVIDTSGSMDSFNKDLAEGLNLFLEPILNKYPYYNYHFAFTTMSPKSDYDLSNQPLHFESYFEECGYSENMRHKSSNIGNYLQYSYGFSKISDINTLLCVLKFNIKNLEGNSGTESYFNSVEYILDHSPQSLQKDFFGKDKILSLFFISDSWQGVDYSFQLNQKSHASQREIAAGITDKHIKNFERFFDIEKNLRTYAVVHSAEASDACGKGEGSGATADNYPFHLYDFLEKTQGVRFSICDKNWGNHLHKVSDNFLSTFSLTELFLDEFPLIESLELYFNDEKIPYDFKEGWFFDLETLSIQIGSQFNWSKYVAITGKELDESHLRILYHPMNLQILQKGKD